MACIETHDLVHRSSDATAPALTERRPFARNAAFSPACAWTALFACIMAMAFSIAVFMQAITAYAEDIDTDPQADEFQQEVERTAAEYEDAIAQVDAAKKALEENRARVAELETAIPAQQERSDVAARELYKIEQQGGGILELLLGSQDFYDFLTNLEYASRASQAHIDEIHNLTAMKLELDETQANLKQAKADADEHAKEAEAALNAAKEARQEAQRRAQEEAQRQAEAAAAAAAAEAAAQEQASAEADKKEEAESRAAEQEKSNDAEKSEEAGAELDPPSSDGADWSSDQSEFISGWAARIDAYLEGSPLSGQGRSFALAAWNYGVDPRWSPAISFTESSKGAACFLPHNAWGWGSASWGSWEEAIDAHVRGLARGYGYTISVEAAQKYCPPNWQAWYERTLAQMNLI